ncbi:MAG: nucleotidyltransferase domain-containing protein [Desulfobacterales bacterium]|jgi:predicted nucleotidyltransferase
MRLWTAEQVRVRPGILRLGYFGSYARSDWGVGSDLDVIAIVRKTVEPFERRSLEWDLSSLPVPAEIIVYSLLEWEKLEKGKTRFFRMLDRDVVWTFSMHPHTAQ